MRFLLKSKLILSISLSSFVFGACCSISCDPAVNSGFGSILYPKVKTKLIELEHVLDSSLNHYYENYKANLELNKILLSVLEREKKDFLNEAEELKNIKKTYLLTSKKFDLNLK